MRRKIRMISVVLAAVLALTMTACGGGNGKEPADSGNGNGGGSETASTEDYVYSAEQIFLADQDGFLSDLSIDNLVCRDGRLYASGYSYGYSDSGSHVFLNCMPDGSELQYCILPGGGTQDVVWVSIGDDGNYYIAGLTYNADSMDFTTVTGGNSGTQDGPGPGEGPGEGPSEEYVEGPVEGPDGTDQATENGTPGPAGAYEEEDLGGGPGEGPEGEEAWEEGPGEASEGEEAWEEGPGDVSGEEESWDEGPGEEVGEGPGEDYGPGSDTENTPEYVSNGEMSPADDPALQEESTDGITSPADEYKDEMTDAESELIVTEVPEGGPSAADDGIATYFLACITPEGEKLWAVPAVVPQNAELDYYINAITCGKEGIYVGTSLGMDLYSTEDGSFIKTVSTEQAAVGTIPYVLKDGTVAVLTYGSGGEEMTVIDPQTGNVGESFPIPSEAGMTSLYPGDTYQLYLAGTNAIYGMNLDGAGAVKLLDYVDSDMDIAAITGLTEIGDGKLAAVAADLTGTGTLEILTKVPPEVVANRKTIKLGSYYLDYEVRKQIFAFNKESQDVRISIEDYSKYDGESGGEGMTKLNTDIVSGSAPDILVLSPVMPVKSYINKGVFEDLAPYMEQDQEISGKEYLTNIFDTFKTEDKMYAIIPSFYVNTIVGKTEDIGDASGLTLDFVDKLAADKGIEPAGIFGVASREDILYQAMEMCGDQFIDWEKSECKFNSPEFIRLLEFIAQFPAKIEENAYQDDITAYYRSGKALLGRDTIGTFDDYVNLRYGTFGTEITMAGFPSQTPGTAVISPQLEIAVNASSKDKDACWSFVRRFLLDDYQNTLDMYWPVSIDALDRQANKAMEPLYYNDENGNRVEDHIIMNIGGENIELPRISDSEVDAMYAFLKGLRSEAYFDSSVENIIAEESAAFFEGQKSAKDVADVIQSRVQIYINENS